MRRQTLMMILLMRRNNLCRIEQFRKKFLQSADQASGKVRAESGNGKAPVECAYVDLTVDE